jgi:hypothetical protein
VGIQEDGASGPGSLILCGQLRLAAFEIVTKRFAGFGPQRDDPELATLAVNPNEPIPKKDVFDIETDEFGKTQATAVIEVDHGEIPGSDEIGPVMALYKALGLFWREIFGPVGFWTGVWQLPEGIRMPDMGADEVIA